jgi:hypothetical protein
MSYLVKKETLTAIPVPQQTRTYKPVSHGEIIDLMHECIDKAGFQIDGETYNAIDNGLVANGKYTISNVADSEMKLQIGWQNSYNKTKTLKFAIGAHVIVCENGMVHGDMGNFKKKHIGDIQEFTPTNVAEYIGASGDVFSIMISEKQRMKNIEISAKTRAELIGRMFIEEKIIHSTQLNIISREIEAPSHNYNAPDSMWELYNYTTFSMKNLHPSLWMDNHMEAHKWFVNECGVLEPTKTMITVDQPLMLEDGASRFTQLNMF